MSLSQKRIIQSTAVIFVVLLLVGSAFVFGFQTSDSTAKTPTFRLVAGETFYFNSFVDCNMAEVWVGDTFRIFPGKYGEDPVWGYAHDLKFADGANADQAFSREAGAFTEPALPANAKIGQPGLHGAVWFETVYQDARDPTGWTTHLPEAGPEGAVVRERHSGEQKQIPVGIRH